MRKEYKKIIYLLWDIASSIIASAIAIIIVSQGAIELVPKAMNPIIVVSIAFVIVNIACKTYNSIWSFAGFSEIINQLKVSIITGIIIAAMGLANLLEVNIYMAAIYIGCVFALTASGRVISRYKRWLYLNRKHKTKKSKRTLIVGAGEAGALVVRGLIYTDSGNNPIGFIDDKVSQNKSIMGVQVLGTTKEIKTIIEENNIQEVIIALPSAGRKRIMEICEDVVNIGLSPKIFVNPTDVHEFSNGENNGLKEISIEDILSRDTVKPNMIRVMESLKGKTVLITGGAGSIGSELCRQVLENGCKHLAIVDINENGLFYLNEELRTTYSNYKIYLASIRDIKRIFNVIKEVKPDLVIHAAAHKHVPIVNENPFEAIKNNYVGTRNVIEGCIEAKVSKFVLISTDKAVRPTNVMGATKRMAELLVQVYNGENGCQMSAVRFGNVLGSAGSVIPLFKKQIEEGGPITVTDKRMMRYFMTIPEAVSLVLSSGELAKGGELFVLNMGEPVNIYEIAKKMVILSGLEPHKDIEIKEIGIRPGEKLYEELVVEGENMQPTEDNKIYKLQSRTIEPSWIRKEFDEILKLSLEEKDEQALIAAINKFIADDNEIHEN